jgi:enamine deaminase RidA (YjgF/YER057c/UK114 family)
MSMKQYAYKGFGENNRKSHWYSSAVRTGDFIHCAGQGKAQVYHIGPKVAKFSAYTGGYLDEHGTQPRAVPEQIDQAFVNVDIALKDAGGAGWSQVYRINSFHVSLDEEAQEAMVRNFKKWMPDNHPTWTCVQISRLGGERMWVEIEVSAYDPEGAKKEGTSKA